MDWPHDLYSGRTPLLRRAKRVMYALGLRRLARTPLVWTAHNLTAHDAPDRNDEVRMIQRLVDRCDGIVTFSRPRGPPSGDLPRSSVDPVEVIYHGHYIDAYPNTMTRAEARERLGLDPGARVVLSLGG